jgi:UDP-N-acetylmuramate: L-alanyl-gamma-D-glutamyl-meso-diaminopimelate ligase
MNWKEVKTIYFIGIGGIGMSAVAGLAKARGFEVRGSDATDVYEPSLGILNHFDIPFKIGYGADNLESVDVVVATAAVDGTNPEYAKASELNIPVVTFPELLGYLSSEQKRIVVVGTHGKGSTSGLISHVLKAHNDSSFFVGAVLTNLETNFYVGKGPYFVIEGDEYKSSADNLRPKFSYYNPGVLLINNVEFDHPDIYKDLEAFKAPFRELANGMSEDSLIIYNADDQNVLDVIKESKARKVGFGFKATDYLYAKPELVDDGNFRLEAVTPKGSITVETTLPGMPYAYNTAAATTVLMELGLKIEEITPLVKEYKGVKRRYEIILTDPVVIIDDYAHHPTAVKQTIEATRMKYPSRRIVCFFEPHTYSRTKETLPELENAFASADLVYIAEVYPAREQKLPSSITGQEVTERISTHHKNVVHVENKAAALRAYAAEWKMDDVVVVMAVGSFNTLVYDILKLVQGN